MKSHLLYKSFFFHNIWLFSWNSLNFDALMVGINARFNSLKYPPLKETAKELQYQLPDGWPSVPKSRCYREQRGTVSAKDPTQSSLSGKTQGRVFPAIDTEARDSEPVSRTGVPHWYPETHNWLVAQVSRHRMRWLRFNRVVAGWVSKMVVSRSTWNVAEGPNFTWNTLIQPGQPLTNRE